MTPNLHHFIVRSQKIPAKFLEPSKDFKFSVAQLLSAHFVDFIVICITTSIISSLFQLSILSFLPTNHLRLEFSNINIDLLATSLLPLMTVIYYFFCLFLNAGQTYGMSKTKCRIFITTHSFSQSMLWAVRSASIILTGGLSLFLLKKKYANSFLVHDHLYHTMMMEKEVAAPSLLDQIQVPASEETYKRAA